MTQAQYARHRGQSREAVRKAVRDGKIPTGPGGLIRPRQADRAWLANSAGRSRPSGAGGDRQLSAATAYRAASEARRAYWAAEREEMSARREAGLLVPVDEVRSAATEAAREVASQLQGVRDRLAPALTGNDDGAEVRRLLEQEHRHACEALSALVGGLTPTAPPPGPAGSGFPDAPAPVAEPPRDTPAASTHGRFGR